MISIPCSYSSTLLPPLPHLLKSRFPIFFPDTRLHKLRTVPKPVNAAGDNPSGAGPFDRRSAPRTLFPGGFRRPEIKIPSLLLRISSEEVLRREDAGVALGEALARGVAIVVMDIGEKSGGEGYEAACRLKLLVGDRAYILIAERVDVAAAAGVSGVVLSDQGIPAIVARNMLSKSKSDAVFLPLVARDVHDAVSAENAAISDGADFIIISAKTQNWKVVLEDTLVKHIKVPVFFSVELPVDNAANELASKFESESFGLVISLDDLKLLTDDFLEKVFRTKNGSVRLSRSGYSDSSRVNINSFTSSLDSGNGIAGFAKLNDKEMKLLEVESHLLQEAVAVISKAAPMVIL